MNLETKITIYKFTPQLFTLTRYDYQVVKLCRISLAQNGSDAGVNDRILFIGGNKDDKTLPDSSRGIFLLFEEMRGGRKQDYIPHTDGKVDI